MIKYFKHLRAKWKRDKSPVNMLVLNKLLKYYAENELPVSCYVAYVYGEMDKKAREEYQKEDSDSFNFITEQIERGEKLFWAHFQNRVPESL